MRRDPVVAELVERLLEARHAELVRENRVLRRCLEAERARGDALESTRAGWRRRTPVPRPQLRLVPGRPA